MDHPAFSALGSLFEVPVPVHKTHRMFRTIINLACAGRGKSAPKRA
jgi:hypothetical protein